MYHFVFLIPTYYRIIPQNSSKTWNSANKVTYLEPKSPWWQHGRQGYFFNIRNTKHQWNVIFLCYFWWHITWYHHELKVKYLHILQFWFWWNKNRTCEKKWFIPFYCVFTNTIVSQNYQKFSFQQEFMVVFDNWFDNNWNFKWAFSFNSLTMNCSKPITVNLKPISNTLICFVIKFRPIISFSNF